MSTTGPQGPRAEDWDSYFCRVDEHLASIFVDLALEDAAPLPGLHELVWLRVSMRQPRPDGLPSQEEFERLSLIERAVDKVCGGALRYVGRCTSNGWRDYFLYAADAEASKRRLAGAMAGFPEYSFELGGHPEPGWNAYREFLYPAPRALQTIRTSRMLERLVERGDRPETVRPVAHFARLRDEASGHALAARAQELGYGFRGSHTAPARGALPFTVVLVRESTLEQAGIENSVRELFDLAESLGGEYDGWEAPVCR